MYFTLNYFLNLTQTMTYLPYKTGSTLGVNLNVEALLEQEIEARSFLQTSPTFIWGGGGGGEKVQRGD
jgi:hypothetical protein